MMFWLTLAAAIAALLWFMVKMPGQTHEGALAALSAEEADLARDLRRHVEAVGSREHNVFKFPELEAAARYIYGALEAAGYRVGAQRYASANGEVRNIEVEVAGADAGAGAVVVGAHYDSVIGAPGANDNGSGVAAVLELARMLKDSRPARTLRFVLFVNEEPPFFQTGAMGSRKYVEGLKERGERVAAMFSIETIGYYSDRPGSQRYPFPLSFFYPSTGNFIAFVSNFGSRPLLHESIAAFRGHAAFPSEGVAAPAFIPGVDWSDHWSFWQAGWPAVMVTDTALYRYPHYHAPTDTPDKLDYERLARVTMGLEGMLRDVSRAEKMCD